MYIHIDFGSTWCQLYYNKYGVQKPLNDILFDINGKEALIKQGVSIYILYG